MKETTSFHLIRRYAVLSNATPFHSLTYGRRKEKVFPGLSLFIDSRRVRAASSAFKRLLAPTYPSLRQLLPTLAARSV